MPTTAVDEQTAIVTGASSGIGAATCRGLAAAGAMSKRCRRRLTRRCKKPTSTGCFTRWSKAN